MHHALARQASIQHGAFQHKTAGCKVQLHLRAQLLAQLCGPHDHLLCKRTRRVSLRCSSSHRCTLAQPALGAPRTRRQVQSTGLLDHPHHWHEPAFPTTLVVLEGHKACAATLRIKCGAQVPVGMQALAMPRALAPVVMQGHDHRGALLCETCWQSHAQLNQVLHMHKVVAARQQRCDGRNDARIIPSRTKIGMQQVVRQTMHLHTFAHGGAQGQVGTT